MRTIAQRAVEGVSGSTLIEQRAADRLHAEAVWDLRLLDDATSDSDPCRANTRGDDVRGEDGFVMLSEWPPTVSVGAAGVLPG